MARFTVPNCEAASDFDPERFRLAFLSNRVNGTAFTSR